MTAAELDELDRLVATARGKAKWLACVVEDNPNLIAEHLPALIAIARSAEGLAESVEAILSEYDQGQACVQARLELEGYRKVVQP